MKTNLLLITPAETAYDAMPLEQQAVLDGIGCEWPAGMMPGTHEHEGKQLTHVLAWCSAQQAEQLIAYYQLPWTVIAAQGDTTTERALDPEPILPYLPEIPDGEGTRPVTVEDLRSGVVGLHCYAGHRDWQLAEEAP